MAEEIDLRAALNAVSDVVQNRPRPLREFDQIYMKAGDMVMQSEFVARWADGKRLAFIGDGDAISICTAYLHHRGILGYGPSKVVVYDFDERICQAVKRFADSERLENLDAELYNCLDAFPGPTNFDCSVLLDLVAHPAGGPIPAHPHARQGVPPSGGGSARQRRKP